MRSDMKVRVKLKRRADFDTSWYFYDSFTRKVIKKITLQVPRILLLDDAESVGIHILSKIVRRTVPMRPKIRVFMSDIQAGNKKW
jgi:hypothetical protein